MYFLMDVGNDEYSTVDLMFVDKNLVIFSSKKILISFNFNHL